jgi:hypothetical protein
VLRNGQLEGEQDTRYRHALAFDFTPVWLVVSIPFPLRLDALLVMFAHAFFDFEYFE